MADETRKILCRIDPSIIIGEVTFPEKTPEEVWRRALSAYVCVDNGEKEVHVPSNEESIEELKGRVNIVEEEIETLKKVVVP